MPRFFAISFCFLVLSANTLIAHDTASQGSESRNSEWTVLVGSEGPVGLADVGKHLTWCGDVSLKPDSRELESKPGSGVIACLSKHGYGAQNNILSKESFGDCEVQLDFLIGKGSNAGVKLQERYEIQLYDSHGREKPTGRDCGGIYPHWVFRENDGGLRYIDEGVPPKLNAAKPAGQWQSLKIVFKAPRFDVKGNKTVNARFVSVELNGEVLHQDIELESPTGNASTPLPEVSAAPLYLQMDHGPVAYRNVRVRRLEKSRANFDNTPATVLHHAPDPTGVAVKGPSGKVTYYVAATGPGVQLFRSEDLKKWQRIDRVFEQNVPAWAHMEIPRSNGIWAPDLSYHDGLYYLYYSVSTFGSQRSFIGLAVNKSLDPTSDGYNWQDRGVVIESFPDKNDFNAIDPALFVDNDGRWLLFWGSYWTGIKVVEVDPTTGKPKPDATIQSIATRPDGTVIEAPFVQFHQEYYYLFVSLDSCCDGADSTYRVAVGRSKQATGPFIDAEGKKLLEGGGTVLLESSERWRGPGHNCIINSEDGQWMVHHTYDIQNLDQQRILQVRPLTWQEDGWPQVGEPLAVP